jgi:hypothetical protein
MKFAYSERQRAEGRRGRAEGGCDVSTGRSALTYWVTAMEQMDSGFSGLGA